MVYRFGCSRNKGDGCAGKRCKKIKNKIKFLVQAGINCSNVFSLFPDIEFCDSNVISANKS